MSPTSGVEKPDTSVSPTRAPIEFPYMQLAWFFALLVVVFFPVIGPMVKEWYVMEEMGHGFFVPLVAGYVVWNDRERLLALPIKPCYPAAVLILWGFFQMTLGFLGADLFVSRIGFLIAMVGVIWTLTGAAMVRALIFPLILLLFMIRIPLFIYQQMTFPLQIFASKVAAFNLGLLSIPVLRDGNILELPSQRLQVVEACSGIRSLISLSFLSLAYAYMFDKRTWMRPVLFLATIPIAIAANSFRITVTGLISEYNKAWAEGFYHSFEGWIIFVVAMAILVATHRLVCRFTRPAYA